MKRFLLFAGKQYYPKGGMLDYRFDADTVEEILSKIRWNLPREDATTSSDYHGTMFTFNDGEDYVHVKSIDIIVTFDGIDGIFSWYHIFDAQEGKIAEAYSSYNLMVFDTLDDSVTEIPNDFHKNGKFYR